MTPRHTEATLLDLPMEQLVQAYNALEPATQAGPKTFSTRAKAVARIIALQANKLEGARTASTPVQRIRMLLGKVKRDGWTKDEEAKAVKEAHSILIKEHLSTAAFEWPEGYDLETGDPLLERPPSAHVESIVKAPPAAGRVASAAAAPPRPAGARTIRSIAEAALLEVIGKDPDGRPVGLSYNDILERIKAEVPGCKTSYACLRWYAVHMKERGERMPVRSRAAPKTAPVVEVAPEPTAEAA